MRAELPSTPDWASGLTTVGVTGTNGKTSTTRWVGRCLSRLASPVAMATTLGSFLDDEPIAHPKTWEGFLQTMKSSLDRGGKFASIELTSESLAKGFVKAWPCKIGVFTNLTHDHLQTHGSPEHYLASKAQLFVHLPKGGTAVLNGCDESASLIAEVIPEGVHIVRYGTPSRGEAHAPLDLRATSIELSWAGTRIGLEAREGEPLVEGAPESFTIPAIGEIYAENALAALLGARAAGVPMAACIDALSTAPAPAGRFQIVREKPYVVVDYAHTPDALERTLAIARALCRGQLTVVFGAGGNRDREKRGPMGEASSVADRVILTSDNPRDEDPRAIAEAIRAGIVRKARNVKVEQELDRGKAIRRAIRHAREDDVILIAGKGHETEQISGGAVKHFSDVEVARAAAIERR